MQRFFAEPPRKAPFFAQPGTEWNSFPNIGFERQLVRSGKSLLLIKPWPSGLDYGSLLGSGTLRPILNHLMICLAGNGLVAKDSLTGPRCGRIGLAGFSGGGNEAIKVWRVNRGQIDELYLFDPQSFRLDQNNQKNNVWLFFDANGKIVRDLLEWFRGEDKYLRLIGGLQHPDALMIAANLLPKWRSLLEDYEAGRVNKPPRVWVKPSTLAYRTGIGDGETYAYAMLFNFNSPGALPDLLQCRLTPPGSPASALTHATGLEWIEDANNPLVTKVNIKVLSRVETLNCSHAELAGFLHTLWLPPISGRYPAKLWKERESRASAYISDLKLFESMRLLLAWYIMYGQTQKPFDDDRAKGILIHRSYSVRHQWTTPGGEHDGTRGDKFIGHWEMCLRHSRFRSLLPNRWERLKSK
jgi:hypothetical protein